MTSPLSAIAVAKRRQLAATLGLFAMLFVAIGAVAATGASTGIVKAFVVIALAVAVFLGLLAWGVLRSVRLDVAEHRLDAAIAEVVAGRGGTLCSCGHEHDPGEMHVTTEQRAGYAPRHRDSCSHDGRGSDCSHACDTCLLATMRPAPRRPSPRPRPLPGQSLPGQSLPGQSAGVAPSKP